MTKNKTLKTGVGECGPYAGLRSKMSIEGRDFPNQDERVVSSCGMTNEGRSVASVLWQSLGSLSPSTPDPPTL